MHGRPLAEAKARGVVDDPAFDLDRHPSETTIAGGQTFDAVCGHLAPEQLPMDRPL
ncbi:MAG: hypothetical protein OSA99_08730 [Acidimicrobiales bacterium]|nr:hypothetical protein [Acidimicrobiales bacterium]